MKTKQEFIKQTVANWRWRLATLGLVAATAAPVLADWPNTNATKWVQHPDKRGLDVWAAQPATGGEPLMVADDFRCRKTGPITDIHVWVSWLGNTPDYKVPITLSIWSDVPAVTDPPNVSPSHPGNLLWKQTFEPGQYTARVVGTGEEQFWNPEPYPLGEIMGPDQQIWQYNFYPADPFVQQGDPQKPVVYWLGMTAGANRVAFGWKTSTNHWNDAAVFGHVDAAGNAFGDWKELRDPRSPTNPRNLDLAFALTTGPLITNPPPTSLNKWEQYPQRDLGLDINATFPNIVADDFLCTAAGVITNVQIWASFANDITPNPNAGIGLAFWSDVPAGVSSTGAVGYSHPGQVLCSNWFGPNEYKIAPYGVGDEMFYDPTTGQMTPETRIWQYSFDLKNICCQRGSTNSPKIYWLSVHSQQPAGWLFGWKTSTNHWNDNAVYGHITAAGPVGDWKPLQDPRTGADLDLAFVIQSGPPTSQCDPGHDDGLKKRPKYVQWPDQSENGLDVRATEPKMLADDFPCRRPGPINAITVWGSWLNDKVDTNTIFRLGLWTDIPAVPGTPGGYSRPGQLLCEQTFYPPHLSGSMPRYRFRPAISNVAEMFYDPNLPDADSLIGNDTIIWRYDFYPRNKCWVQKGTTALTKIYWLSLIAQARQSESLFGWKTTTNHWNDDGVFGHVDASGNPLQDWKELRDPRTGKSLDLSFAVRSLPVVGINKDIKNLATVPATGIRIVVAGIHEITWHYDNGWANFDVNYVSGNTVLEWSGGSLPPMAVTHVGAEMTGTSLTIVSMSWLSATGVLPVRPVQVNMHMWGNGTSLVLNNDFVGAPVVPLGGTVEFHGMSVPLDQMLKGVNRDPISSSPLQFPTTPILPGNPLRIQLPQAPPEAMYALFVVDLADAQGQPATMDFFQVPLDSALRPTLGTGGIMDSFFDIFVGDLWEGRTYQLQTSPRVDSFFDVFTEIMTDEEAPDLHLQLPVNGMQRYYRMQLDPE